MPSLYSSLHNSKIYCVIDSYPPFLQRQPNAAGRMRRFCGVRPMPNVCPITRFRLCDFRPPRVCRWGDACTFAHSEEELNVWNRQNVAYEYGKKMVYSLKDSVNNTIVTGLRPMQCMPPMPPMPPMQRMLPLQPLLPMPPPMQPMLHTQLPPMASTPHRVCIFICAYFWCVL